MKKTALTISIIIITIIANAQTPTFQWAKGIGGASNDIGNSIAIDAAENIYATGSFSGTVDFDPNAGIYNLISIGSGDIFISKMDALGNLIWAKSLGATSYNSGQAVALDAFGNLYVTGYFQGTTDFNPGTGTFNMTSTASPGSVSTFILKLDVAGNFVWAKQIQGQGTAVATDDAGNVYTTGAYYNTVDFDPGAGIFNLTASGGRDIFISKLDGLGNFVWAKSMGGSVLFDESYSIFIDTNNNVYSTGTFAGTVDFNPGTGIFNLTSGGANDVFISKLDAAGDFVWAKSFGGTVADQGNSITVDVAGNVYTTGMFKGSADFDPGVGTVYLTPVGEHDAFISKLDASGNFVWAKNFGSSFYDEGSSITIDSFGDIYISGLFQGITDFDPNSGIYNLTPSGQDVYILKLTAAGNFVWAKNFGGTTLKTDIVVTTPGTTIYTIGDFDGTADFEPGSGVFNLTSAGLDDFFIHKLGVVAPEVYCSFTYSINNMVVNYAKTNPNCTSFIWDFGNGTTSTINPNPIVTYATPGIYSPCFQCNTPVTCLSCLTITVPSNGNGGTIGVAETIINSAFSLYPNPTNGILNIDLTTLQETELILYNTNGQQTYTTKFNKTTMLDLSGFANGIYSLHLKNETGVTTQKIILNK
jgi:hypothetical protein